MAEIPVNIDTSESVKNIAELRKNIQTLKNEIESVDIASDEYARTLAKLAQNQNYLNKVNEQTSSALLPLGQQVGVLTDSAAELVGGFKSVVGILQLYGAESETLNNVMVRLQAGVSALQGFSVIITSAPKIASAIKAITASMGALGVISMAIGALVVGFGALRDVFRDNNKASKALTAAHDEYNSSLEQNNRDLQMNVALLEAQGASEEDIIAVKRQSVDTTIAQTEALMKQYESAKHLNKDQKQHLEQLGEDLKKLYGDQYDLIVSEKALEAKRITEAEKEAADAQREAAEERKRIRESELQEIENINERVISSNRTPLEALDIEYANNVALFRKHGIDITAITEQYERERAKIIAGEEAQINQDRFAQQQESLKQLQKDNEQALKDQQFHIEELKTTLAQEQLGSLNGEEGAEGRVAETQAKLLEAEQQLQTMNVSLLENYKSALSTMLEETWLTGEQRIQIEQELAQTSDAIRQQELANTMAGIQAETDAKEEQKKKEKEIDDKRKKQRDATLSGLSQTASAAAQILGESTAQGKALAIAAALIDSFKAGAAVLAETKGDMFARIAGMAAVITTGIVTVKKIIDVKVPGGKDKSASVPSADTASVYRLPIQETTNVLTSTQEQQLQSDTRVWVLESDITGAQATQATVRKESTF